MDTTDLNVVLTKTKSNPVMDLKFPNGAQRAPYFQKWRPLKHNGSHGLRVTNNRNTLFRFSEGHSAANFYVCAALFKIMRECRNSEL